jgi:hypothetical protein
MKGKLHFVEHLLQKSISFSGHFQQLRLHGFAELSKVLETCVCCSLSSRFLFLTERWLSGLEVEVPGCGGSKSRFAGVTDDCDGTVLDSVTVAVVAC